LLEERREQVGEQLQALEDGLQATPDVRPQPVPSSPSTATARP
jgi:hypothetical protein